MLEVIRIENRPISSNCFIIFDKQQGNSCLIVDPGSEDDEEIVSIIQNKALSICYIILTHEHFDHIWSVNLLLNKYPQAQLVCSMACGEMIVDKRRNCSLFYNQIGFELSPPSILTDDIIAPMDWNNYKLTFISTPGHSSASICLLLAGNLFVGDTLIGSRKTVVKLPGGSKKDLKETIDKLCLLKGLNIIVRPGHGECFLLDTYDLNKML